MDRNGLLTATRGAYLRAFNDVLPDLISQSADALFLRADKAANLSEQRRMLDARAALMTREQAWLEQLASGMDRLLNRSYQTAYSTFRPSFSESFSANSLSLVDAGEFDGELKIDELTTRLRNAAEEQLRDLNIRMAILFDQDDINERENPFRPYLLSRCITMAAEQLEIEPELHETLCDSLTEQLLKHVAKIYEALNRLLAQHGIAAQLQLKVRQLPDPLAMRQMAADPLEQTDVSEFAAYGDVIDTSVDASVAGIGAGPQPFMEGGYSNPIQNGIQQPGTLSSGARLGQWSELMRQQAMQSSNSQSANWSGNVAAANSNAAAGMGSMLSGLQSGWLNTVQHVGTAIRQLFGGTAAIQTTPQVLSVDLSQTISQLQQQHVEGVALDAHGQVRNLILEQRAELNEVTQDINEQMIIDIVGMLFEFILRDGQVPSEIRAQLGRLQWVVLKTALQDPALFSHKHHPARLLVNRIGSIAQGLQQLDPKAERVTAEIRRIIETLLQEEEENVALFARMLDELDRFIARELRAADEKAEIASQAIENAESRTLRFARITSQTSEALASFKLDEILQNFFINVWPYAIEFAERGDAIQALRFRIFVPELMWSIAPKVTREDKQELLGMIPRLIGTLNEGLKNSPWTAAQQQQFKTYMIDAHRAAIAGSAAAPTDVPSMAMLRARLSDFISEVASDTDLAQLPDLAEVNPLLLDRAIDELKVEIGFIDAQAESELADLPAQVEAVELSNAELFERLRSGVPIEINLTGKLTQARLCWMSPNETRLLLNLEDGGHPSVLSLSVFRRLLRAGRARWLEQAPLFERAMESLLNSADILDAQAA
ncbi:DUF1631 family protein [Chitinibacter bivalviorum]|uniref:DUF1631 family protein n=1 Tax=Chitinibacter bivalviorum TaxID=2739434 RepID=A0A7H9BIN1_9NEIS|nr:DUF1631 family protein [Chitinibacter bivalviorum]QLG88507.1 DUF1631 family protein [Chitinibacter bivalviorum]